MKKTHTGTAYFQATPGDPYQPLNFIETDGFQIKHQDPTSVTLRFHQQQMEHYRAAMTRPVRVAGTPYRIAYIARTHSFELWKDDHLIGVKPAEHTPTPRALLRALGIYRLPDEKPLIHNGKTPR